MSFDEGSPRPIACASVALTRDGRVLLGKRSTGDSIDGTWELPGGKIEFGEHPSQAAARETREEVGVEATALDFVYLPMVVSNTYENPTRHFVIFLYRLDVLEGVEPEPREGIHSELAWFTPAEVYALERAGSCLRGCANVASVAVWTATRQSVFPTSQPAP